MQTSNFMKIRTEGKKSLHAGGQTDMRKQRVALRNFTKALKCTTNFSNASFKQCKHSMITELLLLCVAELNSSGIFRRSNTNLCKHFTAVYCCHLVVVFYVNENVILLQWKQMRNSESNKQCSFLDNDQLDTHLLYFTIRLL